MTYLCDVFGLMMFSAGIVDSMNPSILYADIFHFETQQKIYCFHKCAPHAMKCWSPKMNITLSFFDFPCEISMLNDNFKSFKIIRILNSHLIGLHSVRYWSSVIVVRELSPFLNALTFLLTWVSEVKFWPPWQIYCILNAPINSVLCLRYLIIINRSSE